VTFFDRNGSLDGLSITREQIEGASGSRLEEIASWCGLRRETQPSPAVTVGLSDAVLRQRLIVLLWP
jgi:hypothetical protein